MVNLWYFLFLFWFWAQVEYLWRCISNFTSTKMVTKFTPQRSFSLSFSLYIYTSVCVCVCAWAVGCSWNLPYHHLQKQLLNKWHSLYHRITCWKSLFTAMFFIPELFYFSHVFSCYEVFRVLHLRYILNWTDTLVIFAVQKESPLGKATESAHPGILPRICGFIVLLLRRIYDVHVQVLLCVVEMWNFAFLCAWGDFWRDECSIDFLSWLFWNSMPHSFLSAVMENIITDGRLFIWVIDNHWYLCSLGKYAGLPLDFIKLEKPPQFKI